MPTKTIEIKRGIAGPVAEVYRAFVNATGLREWFCDSAQTQPKVGGRIFVGWNDGSTLVGKFVQLIPDKKIVMNLRADEGDTDRSQVSITLGERNGKTQVTLSDTSDGKDWLKISHAVEHGWNDSLDNLKSVLETGEDLRITQKPMLGVDLAGANYDGSRRPRGVLLNGVIAGMGAQLADLQKGDVILGIAGEKTPDFAALDQTLKLHKAGEMVSVTFERAGRRQKTTMTLSGRPRLELPQNADGLAHAIETLYARNDKALKQMLKGVSEAQATKSPGPGEWSTKHILAHLIQGERYTHWWEGTLIASQEGVQDDWEGNLDVRVEATVAAYGTLKALLAELAAARRETVALLRNLPPTFVARKSSFTRIATNMLTGLGTHGEEHLAQIQTAINP